MKAFQARIQLPSGGFVDVTPDSGMPLTRGLTDGTDLVPELVTSLWLNFIGPNGESIEVVLPPVAGLDVSISIK